VTRTAWYRKTHPTFSDAMALVRRQLWIIPIVQRPNTRQL
jgi:hypothetical protein